MAPLSLFRLRKHQHRHHQQQRRVVEPLSPASFFTPERSRPPSIDAADIVLEVGFEVEPQPRPEPEPEHEPPQLLEGRSAMEEEIKRAPLSAVPVSASASASAFDIPGPPNLALSLRFSFDAEGSFGDSIERYFLSSHPDIDISRAGPSAPAPQHPSAPTPLLPTISIVSAAPTTPTAPTALAVPAIPIDPIDVTFRARAGADCGTTTAMADQPQLTNNVDINRVNPQSDPTRGHIIPSCPANFTGFAPSSITQQHHQQYQQHQQQLNSTHPRRSPTNLSHVDVISDDHSFHDTPVLHPHPLPYAADDVLDISPSAPRIDLPTTSKSTNFPAPNTPKLHPIPISIPEPALSIPPVPPRPATGHATRKRAAPSPIKIPSVDMHSPRVIVDRVPAERSRRVPRAPSVPLPITSATQQPNARRKRSVEEEIEHVEHARLDVVLKATTTARSSATVAPSRKSITASAYFAAEYALAHEYTLPASSAGDRLSAVTQPPPGCADSATLPEDSPWPSRRFLEDDIEHAQPVPALPALPPALRRTRIITANGNGNRNENESETTRILVVPKRESSLLPSAITAKLFPIALQQSDTSPTSAAEAPFSCTFSQSISGYQNDYPSVPQDVVADDSTEHKPMQSGKMSHTTMASTGSEAEAEIMIVGFSRGIGPPVAMTPAGVLGLQKAVTTTTPSSASSASQSTTAPPGPHLASPPRDKTEVPETHPLRRDTSSQPIKAPARSSEGPWHSTRRTDSLRPSPVVERLMASRDSAPPPLPPTPGTSLTHYLDLYTNTNGEDNEAMDGPASTGSSSLFDTSASERSPYMLDQGTRHNFSHHNPPVTVPSKVLLASTASTATTAAAPPDEQPASSLSSSKPAHPHGVSRAFVGGHGHFRGRSVSDAPPASACVLTSVDRRPSMPESSTSATAHMKGFLSSTKSPKTASSMSSTADGSDGVLPVMMTERPETPFKPVERAKPVRPVLNTNAPLSVKDARESMFPHTPHSFSPVPHSDLEKLLGGAAQPCATVATVAPPPPTIVAPEFTPSRPNTAEAVTPPLGGSLLKSFPSHRAQMRSSSLTSSFSRRDRTLPFGPRQPTIKHKGTEPAEIPRPTTASSTTASSVGNLPTPAMTPPGQTSRANPRQGSISISPPQTHSRTWTKSSTSTSVSASVMEKIDRPTTPTFDTVQVQWRGLTLEAAKWIFDSQELHAVVGRAIRQSADPMSIRLLPLDLLDTDLPAALEDLEVRREEIKAGYTYHVRRRRTLMRELAINAEGTATPASVHTLIEELLECVASCDRLSEELFMVSDQIAQIGRLRDGHSASALAMALRKINTSFLRATGETADLKTQVEVLTAEREEAWAMAETVERELDELRAKMEMMEQATLEPQQQRRQRQALQVVTSPISRTNSTKGSLSRSTSRVSAARKSSMRVSKASLRSRSVRSSTASTTSWRFSTAVNKTPATSSPLFLAPPVPRIPRGSGHNSYSPDGYSPSPRGTPQSLINAQNELLEMLGVPINEFKNGSFIPPHRRSHSVTVLSWGKSPPASPLDSQPPISPVPIPKAPPASKLFRSASIAEHARLSRRKKESYSTIDMEMIYDGILDDPETLFAVFKK